MRRKYFPYFEDFSLPSLFNLFMEVILMFTYRFHLKKRFSFDDAFYACQIEQSDLLELKTRLEYDELLQRISGYNVWLGIKVCSHRIFLNEMDT